MQGQGTVVVQVPGFPPPPLPLAEVGRDYLDGSGHVSSAHFIANGDGTIVTGYGKGTYTVNPDCTGTLVLDFGVYESIVVLADGSFIGLAEEGVFAETRIREKMPKWGSCSLSTLKGAYSVQGEGTVVGQVPGWPVPPFPLAEVTKYSLDGAGGLAGSFNLTVNGAVLTGTLQGTYTVKPNCTGTITSSGGGLPFNQWFVVLRDGSLRLVQTDSWIVILRTMKTMPD
jgi:hypothetical protein